VGAATLARVADEMFSVAVVLYVLQQTGSAPLAGACIAGLTFPSVLSGPVLGAWLDRTERRRWVMVADQLMITASVLGILFAAGHAPNWTLPLFAMLGGLTWPLSYGGFTSLIPVIVPDRLITGANALEATSINTGTIAGPALAGAISGLASPQAALVTEIVLTLLALVLIARMPLLDAGGARSERSIRGSIMAGMRTLVAVPALRGATVAASMSLAGLGLLSVAFPFYAQDLGEEKSRGGILWAAFAAGSAVGALALVRIQDRRPPEQVVIGALGAFGLLMLTWPLAGSLAVAFVLVALAGFADGPGLAATFAVRQRAAPPDLQGQIFTSASGIKVAGFSLGAALAGPAVDGLGAGGAITVAALVQLAGVAVGLVLMRLPALQAEPAGRSMGT
jgi:MFS family permease